MSSEAKLNDELKELDANYQDLISFVERCRNDRLQKAMNDINEWSAKCRKNIEDDYTKHRDFINQQLFVLKMPFHAQHINNICKTEINSDNIQNTAQQITKPIINKTVSNIAIKAKQSKQFKKKQQTNGIKRKHKKAMNPDIIEIEEHIEEPPNKRHKANSNHHERDNDQNKTGWNCHVCTYHNEGKKTKKCAMCETKRKCNKKQHENKKKVDKLSKKNVGKRKKGRFDASDSEEEEEYDNKTTKRIRNNNNKRHRKRYKDKSDDETESEFDYNENINFSNKRPKKPRKPPLPSRARKTALPSKSSKCKPKKAQKLNSYYTNKRNQAIKAQRRFKQFAKDNNGKTMVKLPISTDCTEYTANTVYVTDLGEIPSDPVKAEKYCDKDYIYPIGYKAKRIHLSYSDPRTKTVYFMEILDDGMKGPKYKVYAEDDRDNIMIHKSPTTPWQKIIDAISEKAKRLNCDGKRDSNGTSGKRYLGLRDYLIMGVIELLPNAEKCKTYWKSQKKHNLPPKPFFPHLSTNDIIIQCD